MANHKMIIMQLKQAALASRPYLAALNAEVNQGQFIGIIGPNGAGKSTLLALLSGFISPTSGLINFLQRPLADYSLAELAAKRALVPQLNVTGFDWPVKEYLQLGAPRTHAMQLQRISEALILQDLLERRLQNLSGGELQRVAIGRALCQLQLFLNENAEQQLLLLDEPNSALDIGHQQRLMRLLHQLCQYYQLTIIAVLHDLNLAANYCDQLWLLQQGQLIAQGPVAEVIQVRLLEQVFDVELRIEKQQQDYQIQLIR